MPKQKGLLTCPTCGNRDRFVRVSAVVNVSHVLQQARQRWKLLESSPWSGTAVELMKICEACSEPLIVTASAVTQVGQATRTKGGRRYGSLDRKGAGRRFDDRSRAHR